MNIVGDEDGGWRMEDGLDWLDAHMGHKEIMAGGGWRRGLVTEAGTILSSVCTSTSASLAKLRISQHAYTNTGLSDRDPVVSYPYINRDDIKGTEDGGG